VAVADFNGEGKADLAIPVYSIFTPVSDVSILLGKGDGTFTAAAMTPITGQNAGSVATGDFNGDGKIDLALTLPDANQVMILLGNGDGTFTAGQGISDTNGPFFVTTGDFNGDGRADLAVANPEGQNATILLGNGDGTFTAAVSSPAAGGTPASLTVGDFNGDGIADIAVANDATNTGEPGSVTILLGKGDGTFTTVAETPTTGDTPASIAVGDFNGDGIADLAVANLYVDTNEPGSVTMLLGKGDGTFTPTAVSPATGLLPYSVAVGDFNGDGLADLVTANSGSNSATVLLGNGDGTFGTALSPAAGTNPIFATVGDFNGDGLADIAGANNYPSSATVLLSQLTATATATVNNISLLGTGTHLVDANYPGDTNYAASVSGTTGLTAQPVATTLSLSANPTSSVLGQQVLLTATLSPNLAQNHSASGTVTFYNGTVSLGTGALSSGVATLSTNSLSAGTYSLTASYAGDSNFAASTSPAVTETVTTPDYSITANPGSLTVTQGGSGTAVFTVTPIGGFSQNLQLACSGLPANSTCTFSPATLTPNGAAVTSTMTITTNTQTVALALPGASLWLALAIPFSPAGFLGLLGIRRKNTGKQTLMRVVLLLGAMTAGMVVIGCGGGSGNGGTQATGPVTPAGTSTVTVTASSTVSGGSSHSVTLMLTVTN
jgi:hypothetical protein